MPEAYCYCERQPANNQLVAVYQAQFGGWKQGIYIDGYWQIAGDRFEPQAGDRWHPIVASGKNPLATGIGPT